MLSKGISHNKNYNVNIMEYTSEMLVVMFSCDFLAYVFFCIFRDVRPSNIYVQTDDSLVLGDFGVATIRGDAVTCTRANAGNDCFFIIKI